MKLAIIGATGLVGNEILNVLDERNFQFDKLFLVASEKSKNKKILFRNKYYRVIGIREAIELFPNIAIFSAGKAVSLTYAPQFAEKGTTVIDNSSAWRMDPKCPLIVPEINASLLKQADKIIANPNCSTIQLALILAPLHAEYTIDRIVVSTYQSVTGSGKKAITQLMNERKKKEGEKIYPHRIDLNVLPHIGDFTKNGYTKEEMKIIDETKRILADDTIKITATAVRVPVIGGHSESVNVTFKKKIHMEKIKKILSHTRGVILRDDIQNLKYPMPIDVHKRNEVFVGRIRRDKTHTSALNMWIVADNLRKGAATNAVQIMELLS